MEDKIIDISKPVFCDGEQIVVVEHTSFFGNKYLMTWNFDAWDIYGNPKGPNYLPLTQDNTHHP